MLDFLLQLPRSLCSRLLSFFGGGVILFFLPYSRTAFLFGGETCGQQALSPFTEGEGATCSFSLTPGEQVCEQVWPRMGSREQACRERATDKEEVPGKGVTEMLTAGALGFHPAGEST